MKYSDYNLDDSLASTDLANLFNVYEDPKLGSFFLTNSINRTVNFTGLDNHSKAMFASYRINAGDTWTTIAHEYYGNSRLWWVICKSNNISDPMSEPVAGESILLIRDTFLSTLLEKIKLG